MAKSKENTTVNENGRIRFALYTDESTMELVDKHYKEDDMRAILKRMKLRIVLNRLGDILAFATATVLFVVLVDEFHRGLVRVESEPDAPIFIYHCVFL